MKLTTLAGNTPLIRISDRIYAKLETYNPTGSVKDRVVTYLVDKAIREGKITGDSILCEATSGNTGIALSACAASLGLKCIIYMPENMSEERRQMMRAYGAEIIDAPADDFAAAISMRDNHVNSSSNVWSPNQFENQDNIECHRTQTAPEILADVEATNMKSWDAFIHGSGTGGTIEGVRRFIVDKGLTTKVCMTVPSETPHGIQGIADGKEFLAKASDMNMSINISTQDAIDRAKLFAKTTGLLVGISSGANILAAESFVDLFPGKGAVVTMLCDRGERYMTIY